ncbi:BAG family molecular chaperone regulator 5, mitochondrial [Sesamum alatum]|uniref:BAG family molecular chaperone regulator 5, mitochondrial n=1 Tax=Sesamum alatum TaxID=300844 RepID=A0AAE1XKN8_9LAMI|nr:BAG family molecular chaperone regulator 5, mitochondrial [Sesamum alatum]
MDAPFFNNRVWYQQPDPKLRRFPHSAPFRGVPVYQVDPASETHGPAHPGRRPPGGNPGTKVVQIPIHFVGSEEVDRSGFALKVQKVFRGFLVRKCLRKIKDIKVQVDEIEERLSTSEVRDLVRRDERERVRMNESLMSLLFKLDSICGVDFGVRSCRKAVIRKVIALQERIDAIVAIDLGENGENCETVDHETESKVPVITDGSNQNDDSEGNDGEVEITDIGVDQELKMNEANYGGNGDDTLNLDLVQETPEGVKKCSSEMVENDKVDDHVEGTNDMVENDKVDDHVEGTNEGNGADDNERNRELLERMVEENEKMNKANYGENGVNRLNLDLVHESLEGVKECSGETVENDKVGDRVEGVNKGNGADDNKRNRELLERMVEENEKMMSLMTQLFERNEAQMRLLNALTQRVELLEKAFVCDRLRKKKKCKAAAACRED